MFLSKIWLILVTVVGGVALSIALTAPRPMAQKLEELEGQRLDRSQYATEQVLKVDARKWIDFVAKMGRDAVLTETLDSATRGGDLVAQHKTVQSRFRSLIPDLGAAGIVTLAAVDGNGRVVARVGEQRDNDYGDNIGGAEVVADALRGYLSDDVWGAGGRLVRVAAAPVLSKGRDRYVGALYVGAETGTGFVERLKKNLEVDAALLLQGKVIASTIDAEALGALGDRIAEPKYQAEIDELKRTSVLPVETGGDTLLGVAAPFPGQASQQRAYYVLFAKKPAKADLASLLAATSARDLGWARFPWIPLVTGILGVVLVGLLLQRMEVERPIERLRAELRRLAAGDAMKLDDHRHGGKFGGIARDVNAAIEHYTHAPEPPRPMADKDLGAILGGAGAGDGPAAADRGFPGEDPFAPPPIGGLGAPPPIGGPSAHLPSTAFSPPPPVTASPAIPAPAPGLSSAPRLTSSSFAHPPPPAFAPPSAPPASPGLPPPPAAPAASRLPPPPASGSTAAAALEEEERHVQQVFDEFLSTKQRCGESIAGLTLERFRLRLQENRNTLMAKHACRTVRFAVHVKDGKASLRATPVK
jgi:hypothetical protein